MEPQTQDPADADQSTEERRSEERITTVFKPVVVRAEGFTGFGLMRNLSANGAMVDVYTELLEGDAVELSDSAATIERKEDAAVLQTRRENLLQFLKSDIDRRLLELRLSGERKTSVFADVLAITDLPIAEQRRIVKQHKDRIDKIVRRAQERS